MIADVFTSKTQTTTCESYTVTFNCHKVICQQFNLGSGHFRACVVCILSIDTLVGSVVQY